MKRKAMGVLLSALLISGSGIFSLAEMQSENHRITTSVMSGGGSAMGSANFQMNSTLGQSSPLMDAANPPYSDSYDLYPGYWYTMAVAGCFYDLDGDGDVDGQDLAALASGFGGTYDADDLAGFALEFGGNLCP
jgi:hypothetical protein